jgi:hypothetical protein
VTTYICKRCGYGIAVANLLLPNCPMCRASLWQKTAARRERMASA